MADFWNVDWLTASPMFAPLRGVGAKLPTVGWPNAAVLDAMADESGRRIVNASGERIRFVEQRAKPERFEQKFEPSTYLRGEVPVRAFSWHDLFNALVWMAFPTAKAALNSRHFQAMAARTATVRSPEEDALTLFDEEGVAVLSSDPELLALLSSFKWRELFWERRDEVRQRMRFLLFGHALYEKALNPFVGMTGKGLLFPVPSRTIALPGEALSKEVDRLLALHIFSPENLKSGSAFSPLPVLGIPGWWPENESETFYANEQYFRPGRARQRSP
jgi:hypothetical protein